MESRIKRIERELNVLEKKHQINKELERQIQIENIFNKILEHKTGWGLIWVEDIMKVKKEVLGGENEV